MTSVAPPQTGYAPVNGLRLYYEIHGPVPVIDGFLDAAPQTIA